MKEMCMKDAWMRGTSNRCLQACVPATLARQRLQALQRLRGAGASWATSIGSPSGRCPSRCSRSISARCASACVRRHEGGREQE